MPTTTICQRHLPNSAPPDNIPTMGTSDSEVYEALFDLSQAIAGHTDLETLCNSLAASLRRVISFDFLALVLHDPVHDQLRLHAVSADRPYKDKQIVLSAAGDHAGARVWRDQKPLVLSPLEKEARRGEMIEEALKEGIHALILVPLSNGDRRLGDTGSAPEVAVAISEWLKGSSAKNVFLGCAAHVPGSWWTVDHLSAVVDLHALGFQPDVLQHMLHVRYSPFRIEITFQVMTVAGQSTCHHDAIGTVLDSPQHGQHIHPAGAGYLHDLNCRRVLDP